MKFVRADSFKKDYQELPAHIQKLFDKKNWLSPKLKLTVVAILLSSLDFRVRGNDKFFQYIFSLAVIPAKAGIQILGLLQLWR